MAALFAFNDWSWINLGLAFGLFRAFDVWKLPFIKKIEERCKDGTAIMLDDVVAGICAGIGIVLFETFGAKALCSYAAALMLWYADTKQDSKKAMTH